MFKNAKYKNLGENLYNKKTKVNIANINPHGPDDGSVEPKRYRVDFSINLSLHLDYLVFIFSLHIVGLQSIIYFRIYKEGKGKESKKSWTRILCHNKYMHINKMKYCTLLQNIT